MGRGFSAVGTCLTALIVTASLLVGNAGATGPPNLSAAKVLEDVRSCASAQHQGGEWRGLNGDLANTRNQKAEQVIGPTEATRLRPAWSFSAASIAVPGAMRSTPVVADGCVYLAFGQGYLGDRGDVVALNADTGHVVWHRRVHGSVLGLTVRNHRVYAAVSAGRRSDSPFVTEDYVASGVSAMAFDASTGTLRWRSRRLDDGDSRNGTFINATPVAFSAGGRQLVFVPLAGGAGDGARVPMYFLDARTGRVVKRSLSLAKPEYRAGYGGTGIWSTAAFDPIGRHLYAGTADSDGHTRQHRYNNAILKIDADPRRATFGEVVGHHRGTTEHANLDALVGGTRNPLCGATAGSLAVDVPTFLDTSASIECLELDLDFGASPNLYRGAAGRLKVVALQKSGVVHSVDTGSMRVDWQRFVGSGGAAMNSGTSAVAAGHVFTPATPNLVLAHDDGDGSLLWASTTEVDAFAYGPVTHANGVLYAVNNAGFLVALEARTGRLLTRSLIARHGQAGQCLGVGSGVAVARNTVYAPCNGGGLADLAGLSPDPGGLVAYRTR
ncbi:MAG: PQQ-binding-like beta-propeller repeat protein [Nocardioides sp.]